MGVGGGVCVGVMRLRGCVVGGGGGWGVGVGGGGNNMKNIEIT